ncbi:MAG: hypothetical protein WCT04_23695 [Planctomycetota bacterium]
MTTAFSKMKNMVLAFALIMTVLGTVGCHRTEDDFDDRTLAKRPHVETMKPEDRKDIFRP